MKPGLPALVLGLLVAFPAAADPVLECNGGTATTAEIAACIAETEIRVNLALEAALDFAMAVATDLDEMTGEAATLPALDEAQAAWRDFRDAHCAFIAMSFGDPEAAGIEEGACRVELGRARVSDLLNAVR